MKTIRRMRDEDKDRVIEVWLNAGDSVYSFLPRWPQLRAGKAREVFSRIADRCEIWVGVEGEEIIGYLALNGSYIDRLYIDPEVQRKGWGTAFLDHARKSRPKGLELHTHQENHGAKALYEKEGFVAVKFGLSPPPENVPDVEYHWRPSV